MQNIGEINLFEHCKKYNHLEKQYNSMIGKSNFKKITENIQESDVRILSKGHC